MNNRNDGSPSPASAPVATPHGLVSDYHAASHLTGESLRIAAIDVGSNSIHMVVAQLDPDGGVTTLWRMKEPTGLGRLTFPSRNISADAMNRALATLARFKHAARNKAAEKIVAVATSAVREAQNGGDLIERAKRELKFPIRVVSAKEEARLIYLGIRHGGCFGERPDEPHLAVDIGGGSVEFIVGTNERAMILESRKLGAARMTAKFIKSDPPTKEEVAALRAHYDRELQPIVEQASVARPVAVVGTSGTLENIARLCGGAASGASAAGASSKNSGNAGAKVDVPVIDTKKLDKLAEKLLNTTSVERAAMADLDDGRKDQIIAGVLLVQSLLHKLKDAGHKRMTICGTALREGILIDYVQRKQPSMRVRREVPDPRRRSVLDLCRRCEWHKGHSEQVTWLTLRLFDELRGLHKLGPIDRELIEYAALMHDVGWHIGRKKHHKHSAYLIRHGKLKEFSDEEVAIMANVARYHRKAHPKKGHDLYAKLAGRARHVVDVGASLLRIADGLDRSHGAVVREVTAEVTSSKIKLTLDVRADAELEVWGARRKAALAETVFGRKVEFETR